MAALPAMAQQAEPGCPAQAAPLPAELAGWATKQPLAAAIAPGSLDTASLAIGSAADVTLSPTPSVSYALRPERPGGSVSHGGMVGFTIETAGTYRVALGSGAWIDVVRDGQALVLGRAWTRASLLGHSQDGRLRARAGRLCTPDRGQRCAERDRNGHATALNRTARILALCIAAGLLLGAAAGWPWPKGRPGSRDSRRQCDERGQGRAGPPPCSTTPICRSTAAWRARAAMCSATPSPTAQRRILASMASPAAAMCRGSPMSPGRSA
ncbi:MAG: hypothetical protein WDN24_03910 [Sphingomonas sp.]